MRLQLWQMLGIYHVLPSIVRISFWLVFIYLFIKLFQIKNPAVKSLLFVLPLIKGYVGLLLGTGQIDAKITSGFIGLSLALGKSNIGSHFSVPRPDIFYWSVIVGIVIACCVNSARWIAAGAFYRRLSLESEVGREEAPSIFKILDKLVPEFGVNYPKVILCHNKYAAPSMLGIKKPKLIFSPNLLGELTEKELSLIIAHELAHLKRRDYLLHWVSFVLRDCQFFNPMAYWLYKRIEIEKEKAADLLAIEKLRLKPKDLAATLSKVNFFMLRKGTESMPLGSSGICGSPKECGDRSVFERIHFLLNYSGPAKSKPLVALGALSICLFVFFFNFTLGLPVAQRMLILY